jgi:hypothetical protein
MDALLSNAQIKVGVQERWPDLTVRRQPFAILDQISGSSFDREWNFGLDMLAKNLDPAMIVFSDEISLCAWKRHVMAVYSARSMGDHLSLQLSELNSIKIERIEISVAFLYDSGQLALKRPMKACVACD